MPGDTITLPGNNTRSDFKHSIELAAQIIENPSAFKDSDKKSLAIVLHAWAKSV